MTQFYRTNEQGARELHLHYGMQEVSFDEPHLFAFGERLAKVPSFLASEVVTWGPGYTWDELSPLLEALLEAGLLRRGEVTEEERQGGLVPSLVPPSVCPAHRTWSAADCEPITRELAGRPVEVGYMESILSVYRIPHPALDGDDRQVGEANVFPPDLRLDRDTEWRTCQYAGSRYRDERPMNITALKAMIKHWKPMMKTLLAARAEIKRRLPRSADAGWTVGDLHHLSAVVLSLPSYQLMKGGGSSPQPPLHPVLSSLFRITDGIRMTTHEMIFLSSERTRDAWEPLTWQELYEFAERNGIFLGDTGVCAGPRPLIDEFLSVAVDGVKIEGFYDIELAPEVESLLAELPEVVDYGFLGLQVWGVTRAVWLLMSLAYKALREIFEGATGGPAERIREHLERDWHILDIGRLAGDYDRDVHMNVYEDCYLQGRQASRIKVGPPTLPEQLAPRAESAEHRELAARLHALLAARLFGVTFQKEGANERITQVLMHYLRQEQSVLRGATAVQAAINELLERPRPTRPLTARDLRVNYRMYRSTISQFPYLFETLEQELGIAIECDADACLVTDRKAGAAS